MVPFSPVQGKLSAHHERNITKLYPFIYGLCKDNWYQSLIWARVSNITSDMLNYGTSRQEDCYAYLRV